MDTPSNESVSEFHKYQSLVNSGMPCPTHVEKYPNEKSRLLQPWEEEIIVELEEMLTSNINSILTKAVEIISANGYTAYEAREAIWKSCLKSQTKKFNLEIVVSDALAYLNESSSTKVEDSVEDIVDDFSFRDLTNLVSCIMFGMLWIVMQFNPAINLLDAMWSLVMSDLNVDHAMKMEESIANEIRVKEAERAVQSKAGLESNVADAKLKSGVGNKKERLHKSTQEIKLDRRLARAQKSFLEMKATEAAKCGMKIDEKKESADSIVIALPAAAVPEKRAEAMETPPVNYYAGIPYDQSLMKYCPRDEKEEMIVNLVPQLQGLEKEMEAWSEWTNTKVMQAMHMIGKNRAELNMLRNEKEEVENMRREKEKMEENVAKKMVDMEGAWRNACWKIEGDGFARDRLEEEKLACKKERERVVLEANEADDRCKAAMEREKETMKKVKLVDGEKASVNEELRIQKIKAAQMQPRVDKAVKRFNETKVKWKQEEEAKENALMDGASIREERQRIEAEVEEEEYAIKVEAELEKQRCMEKMRKMETQISALTVKSETALIAKLRKGMAESYSGSPIKGDMIPRECVMCLCEELSVLFLPCAHQVLCRDCNEIHKRKGMADCPSCRTTIQTRILTRFRYTLG